MLKYISKVNINPSHLMPTYDFKMYAAVHGEGKREVVEGIKADT